MRKANILIPILVIFILALIILIGLLVIPSRLQKKNSASPDINLPETSGQTAKDAETERQDKLNCPTVLVIYYTVDRKDTGIFEDDDIYVGIRNPDLRSYQTKLYLNGKLEGEITLLANASTRMLSPTITAWWRAGSERDSNSFPVELSIPGCRKTLSELVPSLPLSQVAVAGGGGGGSSPSLKLDITISPGHVPD